MQGRKMQTMKYVLGDYVMLNIGWVAFTLIRYRALPDYFKVHYSFTDHLSSLPVLGGQILIPLVMLALYWLSGYYNTAYFKSRADEVVNTMTVSALGAVVIFFAVLVNDGIPERLHNLEMLLILWGLLCIPVLIERLVLTGRTTKRIRQGALRFDTLVTGTDAEAVKAARQISRSQRRNGFRITGFIDTEGRREAGAEVDGLPVFAMDEVAGMAHRGEVSRVVMLPQPEGMKRTTELVSKLLGLNIGIYVTPDLHSLLVSRPRFQDVVGEPLVDITRANMSQMTKNCKRAGDVAVSALALLVLSPVYLALAIAVTRDSKGPVLYRQQRIGYHKKPFMILKFRSMTNDAEAGGPELTTENDPRVTRLGRVMRKYRLDELPQFYNVLKGEMSIVGPRPEREFYIRQIEERVPYYSLVHQVRPGITSWGMVKYGYAKTIDEMVERLRYDLLYLENVSLPVDMRILFHTVSTVLTGKGM